MAVVPVFVADVLTESEDDATDVEVEVDEDECEVVTMVVCPGFSSYSSSFSGGGGAA